jgi:hypothetical protein
MATESDVGTRARAHWLRKRLEGKISADVLAAVTDEELIEQYEWKQQRKLYRLKE